MADESAAAATVPGLNPHRGEVAIELEGRRFVMLPTFEAVAAIEAEIGSVMALTKRGIANPSSLTLHELGVVVTEGIRAWGRDHKDAGCANSGLPKIQRMIFNAGTPMAVLPVILFLQQAITGGAQPKPGKA